MAKPFKYRGGERTAEDEVRDSKKSSGGFDSFLADGIQFYKPREGENNIRLMPCAWEDTDEWGKSWDIDMWVHYGVGGNEDTYLCLNKNKGETNGSDCPICAAAKATNDKDEASALKAKLRPLCYVIDRDNERAGPQVFPMPFASLNKEIHARSVNKKTGDKYNIDDPDEGFDISFTKEGTKLNTKYTQVSIDIGNPSALSDSEKRQAKWLQMISDAPLPDLLNYFDAEYLEGALEGQTPKPKKGKGKADDDDDDDDDEDAKPAKRGAVTRKRGKVADDEDEEADERATRSNKRRVERDEDEEEDDVPFATDDEDEDEPTPRKGKVKAKSKVKSKAKSKARDDEEEDDEDTEADEGEDEEDTAPRRRGRKASRAIDDEEDDAESDGEDEEDEDDDDEPRSRKSRKPTRRASARDEDDDDEEDDAESDGEDEEDEDEPAPRKTQGKAKAKLAALKKRKGR